MRTALAMAWADVAKIPAVKVVPQAPVVDIKRKTAVIDANAIISGNGLLALLQNTDRVVTVPEVLREVRDKQSRAWLAALPFAIETLEPGEESLKAGGCQQHRTSAFPCPHTNMQACCAAWCHPYTTQPDENPLLLSPHCRSGQVCARHR